MLISLVAADCTEEWNPHLQAIQDLLSAFRRLTWLNTFDVLFSNSTIQRSQTSSSGIIGQTKKTYVTE